MDFVVLRVLPILIVPITVCLGHRIVFGSAKNSDTKRAVDKETRGAPGRRSIATSILETLGLTWGAQTSYACLSPCVDPNPETPGASDSNNPHDDVFPKKPSLENGEEGSSEDAAGSQFGQSEPGAPSGSFPSQLFSEFLPEASGFWPPKSRGTGKSSLSSGHPVLAPTCGRFLLRLGTA